MSNNNTYLYFVTVDTSRHCELLSLTSPPFAELPCSICFIFWYLVVISLLRGQGGVPWVQILGTRFNCPANREGHGAHFANKVVDIVCS